MKKDNRILIILIPGFPRDETDTTCLPMQQAFTRMIAEQYPGIRIQVLSFQYPYLRKDYRWHNIPVTSFDGRNKSGFRRLWLRRKIYKTLKAYHSSFRIVGLLSFWYGECAWVGNHFAGKFGLPHYCWLMGQDAKKENNYPVQLELQASELIAISDSLQQEFKKNHGIYPTHIIYPGTDCRQFSNLQQERKIDILAAGSLIPLKRYDLFLEIVAAVRQQLPGIQAALIGNGPEKSYLQSLLRQFDLQSTVSLMGELSHPEVLTMMARSKLFLHTSAYEGFSGVCLEALQAGCSVISFCKPLNRGIAQWHIAASAAAMQEKTLEILQGYGPAVKQPDCFKLEDTVKKIMGLFTG